MSAIIDKKVALTACVVVAFILSSSMLILFYNNEEEDNQLRLIGRVNTEGSGIYLKEGQSADDYVTVTGDTVTVDEYTQRPNWGGKVFGTPGPTTIQHLQLQSFVVNTVGLKFAPFSADTTVSSDTVYYLPSITNAAAFKSSSATIKELVGGIIWEPQFSLLLSSSYKCVTMLKTSELEPGHTCCVIGASHEYIENNSDITVRFLAAYLKTVQAINDAKADHSSDAYKDLVTVAMNMTGIEDSKIVESALENVNFVAYNESCGTTAPLSDLETTIQELAESYYKLGGVLKVSMSSMGFSSTHTFAQTYVDDGYLSQAISFVPSAAGYSTATISVAYITGDIHTSLALGYGIQLGIFSEYGISIKMSAANNGAGVATSLQNGESDFGFMGAPPILTTTINSKLVTA